MQAEALGPGLGFPGQATLSLGTLLHLVLGVWRVLPGHGGGEGARRQGACCFEQARLAGDRVSAQLYFWLDRLAGTAACRGAPPSPAHSLLLPLPR